MVVAELDGAYFGTTFPHLFFMTYEDKVPVPCREVYVPRVFGFKVSPRSKCFPRPAGTANGRVDDAGASAQAKDEEETEAFGGKRVRTRHVGGLSSDEEEDGKRAAPRPSIMQQPQQQGQGGGGGSNSRTSTRVAEGQNKRRRER
jgi:hypothetical protein